ncbi:MAG: hypothetical protein KAS32_19715 [Candidatus Peribacteraceae bacterium]|nr:hypothetical protein [Candidatus Peribacteraceae bacterium]
MAPSLKRYIHTFKAMPENSTDMEFDGNVKIYYDHYRTGVRLDGTYNKWARAVKYIEDSDSDYVTFPEWNPDAIKSLITFEEDSSKPDDTTITWRVNDGTNDYFYFAWPTSLLLLIQFNDITPSYDPDFYRDGSAPVVTPVGSPSIVSPGDSNFGTGALDATGGGVNGVLYEGAQLAALKNKGTIRFRVKTNYSGAPVSAQIFFAVTLPPLGENTVAIGHDSATGFPAVAIGDDTGGVIFSGPTTVWNPVAGTWYEFELTWDSTPGTGFGGVFRIDGVEFHSETGTGSRTAVELDTYAVGSYFGSAADFTLDEVQVFDTVQHTADYTPLTYEFPVGVDGWSSITSSVWNTEDEISANISTFTETITSKKIKFIAKLRTTDDEETPILYGYKLLIGAQFDWWEDLVIRSLVPSLRNNFTFIKDFSAQQNATGTTFNIKTDADFIPEEDLNISSIDAVYNHTDDSNHDTDLFNSYNSGTGLVTLTTSVAEDKVLFIRFVVQPEIALNFTDADYTEVAKTPAIILDSMNVTGHEVKAEKVIVDKVTPKGYRMNNPFWCERVTFLGVLTSSKNVDAMRAVTAIHEYMYNAVGKSLQTKALDTKLSMTIEGTSRYSPRVNFGGLRSSSFQITINNFYAWLKDIEEHYVIEDFNYTLQRRNEVGPAEEFEVVGRQNAGVVKPLVMMPVIEE